MKPKKCNTDGSNGKTALLVLTVAVSLTLSQAESDSSSRFVKDIDGYMSVCQRLGWEPKKNVGCFQNDGLIAFHAVLKSHLQNVPVNTTLKFEDVLLNKGNGYDPKTGVFTAPQNGVYSFDWTFVTTKGSSVYLEAVVDGVGKASACIKDQASHDVSVSGHLLSELKEGNKVEIKTAHVPAGDLKPHKFNSFTGHMLR
ncbi:complement C1q-like protein 2 [Ostrea edulis]|uniref:complement C1q-like protein 2 n=1 Tax=Ostrea edulis TaxID=37623 RepID=UPI0024AFCA12|nr:complement C1q-like protein 2 [Ostrea edulis]